MEVTQAVLLLAAGEARTKVLGGAVALSLAWRPKRAGVPPGCVPLGKGLLMWGSAIGAAWAAAPLTQAPRAYLTHPSASTSFRCLATLGEIPKVRNAWLAGGPQKKKK